MWDLPRPGLEPVSPALAGRFSTAAPPGKPHDVFFSELLYLHELPHQNSGVYIKLDLESLTHPMRLANLNYHDDCLSPAVSSE